MMLTAQAGGAIASTLERGTGTTLDDLRTARFAGPLRPAELQVAQLTGGLVSPGQTGVGDELAAAGIEFVVVTPEASLAGDSANSSATDARTELLGTLDGNPDLTSIGTTESGDLWRVNAAADQAASANVEGSAGVAVPDGPTPLEQGLWLLQLLIVLGVLLMALPTAEVVDRPTKQLRVGSKRWRAVQNQQQRAEAEGASAGVGAAAGAGTAAAAGAATGVDAIDDGDLDGPSRPFEETLAARLGLEDDDVT
jgi:hypothetical protein